MDRPPAPMTNVAPPISVATASLRYFDRQTKEAKSAEGNDLSCPSVSAFSFSSFHWRSSVWNRRKRSCHFLGRCPKHFWQLIRLDGSHTTSKDHGVLCTVFNEEQTNEITVFNVITGQSRAFGETWKWRNGKWIYRVARQFDLAAHSKNVPSNC